MADLTAREGPLRVGDVSGERACASSKARCGIRERGRIVICCAAGVSLVGEVGLPEKDASGDKGGENGSAGDDS